MNSGSSIYTIDTGKTRDTTFKIDIGGYVFSCLFDSGAEFSCLNMETVAALGLISQITPSSISVNTANGDHMGVAGDVRVNFKIGRKFSFTYNFVVCERLSCPFIIGEDFMRKHYMSLQWVPENKCALGFQGETIVVASQAVLDEPLRLMISMGFYWGIVCRVYQWYSTNLVSLACERVVCLYGWNPYL